jgi:type IV secretory pathway VirJ component
MTIALALVLLVPAPRRAADPEAGLPPAIEERRMRLPIVGDATRGAHVSLLEGVGHGYGNEKKRGEALDQGLVEIARATDEAAASKPRPKWIDPDLEKDLDALDLPLVLRLVERPRAFLLFISGDGGWSSLDKTLVDHLAQHGVSTVAINTLKYFWSEKSPDQVATDLKRLVDVCRHGGLPLFREATRSAPR